MEDLFETIVNNFRNGKSINEITKEIKFNISNKSLDTSDVIVAFIKYLKRNYLNENNFGAFSMIDKYLNDQISLQQLSQEIFLKKVVVDQDKRDGHQSQFHHSQDETFLDEMLRVIYEFTRNDLVEPKGVCYDFCLFIAGLSLAKTDKMQMYIWNSIERSSGENNFILFCIEEEKVMVYDPYNAVYLPLEKYDLANVGFKLIKLDNNNILLESMDLTSFNQKIITYGDILKIFKSVKKSDDTELEILKKQNYYDRLGVDRFATFEEIKSSFKNLITKFHPDTNPNDKQANEKSQLIIEAYDCLKSDALRKEYDSKIFQTNPSKDNQPKSESPKTEPPKPRNETPNNVYEEAFKSIIREGNLPDFGGDFQEMIKYLIRMARARVDGGSVPTNYNNYEYITNAKNNYTNNITDKIYDDKYTKHY